MHRLLEIGASNAVTVAALAILVYGFSRLYWRPALVHGLWVLLLIKLLTPPFFELPLPRGWFVENSPGAAADPAESSVEARGVLVKRAAVTDPVVPAAPSLDDPSHIAHHESETAIGDVRTKDLPADVERALLDGKQEIATLTPKSAAMPASTTASKPPGFLSGFGNRLSALVWGVFLAWMIGSSVIVLLIVSRVRRFQKLLRHALPASRELEREVDRLARRLGLRRTPPLLMLPGVYSPMLWGFPRAKILFPLRLAKHLDRPSRETLLLHELAHYRRCDHWTRVLEMMATIAYWWHPCLWWMRREMRAAEEECCDGWVISQSPEYRPIYARALITVMDFLADNKPAMPPAASGVGNFRSATKRLTAIMVETPRQELGRWAGLALVLFAIPCLGLAPTLATGDPPASDPPRSESPMALNEAPPAAAPADPKARLPEVVESGKFEQVPISLDGKRERIRALAYSADGKRMVAAHGGQNSTGSLRVWDVSQKLLVAVFPETKGFCGVHISPDGKQIASCSFNDSLIRVRDLETRKVIALIRADDAHTRVRFSPDGKLLATASMKGTLRVWDLEQVMKGEQPAVSPAKELAKLDFNLQSLAFFPDGQKIAAGGGPWQENAFGFAGVWDITTGKLLAKMEGMPDSVLCLAVSPDGKQVATAGHDGKTRLWDAETGQSIKVLRRSPAPLEWVDYSADGKLLATGSYDDKATVWNAETGGQVALLEEHQGDVMSVRFSPDGSTLATGGEDQTIRLWDVATWQVQDRLQMGIGQDDAPTAVMAVACSPNGRLLATAQEDRTVSIRDLVARRVLHQLSGHDDLVSSLAFSPDGKTLATGSYDHEVKTWDLATGKEKQTFSGHANWVMSVAFSPDGKLLASSSYDKTVRVWDVAKGNERRQLTGHTASVRSVAFSADGKLLATGSSDQTAKLWDVTTGEEKFTLNGHTGAVRAVAFQPEANRLATASEDATVRLWDLKTGKQQSVLQGHEKIVWSLAFSQSGRTLVTGGMAGEIIVWDSESGARLQVLRKHSDIVSGLAFVSPGNFLISASYDMTTRQWIPAAAPLKEIAHRTTGAGPAASFVAFTPDEKRLVTTNKQSGHCRIWDAKTGGLVREFQTPNGHTRSAALSPDGRWLAVAQSNKAIGIWDIASGKREKEFPVQGEINALEFSPNGKWLISAGRDRRARVWNLETGTLLAETSRQNEELQGLACSPDGEHFVTCSGNWVQSREGEVKLWKTETAQEVALLGQHKGRINAVRFTPDGRQLLAATNEGGFLLVFDMNQRKQSAEWRVGVSDSILSLAVSRDGTKVAVGRSSGGMSLWELKTQQKLLDYVGHAPNGKTSAALVWALAFSPDGKLLASAGYDDQSRSLHLWPTSKTEPLSVAWQKVDAN